MVEFYNYFTKGPSEIFNLCFQCCFLIPKSLFCSLQETCESILNFALEEVKQFHGPQKPARKLFGFRLPPETPPPTSGAAVPEAGLVIDGKTLNAIFQGKLEEKFLELTQYCRSVLCCRSTPLQKSMLVKLVRDRLGVMTLSIGTRPAETWVAVWQGFSDRMSGPQVEGQVSSQDAQSKAHRLGESSK